ncbi:hypothetical protein [Acinetobacter pseudolwoffii]|uniref:hypothetical protein n=1 Tax=Acinetobacter pseudolwoffii TaxID=2053287 RepID=UPI0024699978|nr:hypothetical protein [Acinetobacter pseudolwoffii]MDH5820169.1 hypothetical protein [Acinetobacter pseudolwoffii]
MQKLLITALLFMLGLWVWNEFFRAIPHLEERGVLKNFSVEPIQPISATFTVHDKRFVKPNRRVLHQASPMVGHFNDLAYVSNIDVLLLSQSLPVMQATLAFDKAKRCYQIEEQISKAEAEFLSTHVQHFSLIAANEKIANQIRRLKSGQKITLSGDLVTVHSGSTGQEFQVGTGSEYHAHCQLLRVTQLQQH